jgi:hypothetical protein
MTANAGGENIKIVVKPLVVMAKYNPTNLVDKYNNLILFYPKIFTELF